MELLLNLVWLVLVLVAVSTWWTRWLPGNRGRRRRRDLLRGALALTCVLVLLFFAISLTDDLHAVPAVAEEANSSRRAVKNLKGNQTDPDPDKHTTLVAETTATALFADTSVAVGRLALRETPPLAMILNRPVQGRAPPVLSL